MCKTEATHINSNNNNPLLIYVTVLEEIDQFCYLGSVISKNGGTADDISHRINKARQAYGSDQFGRHLVSPVEQN